MFVSCPVGDQSKKIMKFLTPEKNYGENEKKKSNSAVIIIHTLSLDRKQHFFKGDLVCSNLFQFLMWSERGITPIGFL